MQTKHGEHPDASNVPSELRNAVLHARIEMADTTMLSPDIPPDCFSPMPSAYLSLMAESVEEAERIYALLSGGQILMPMAETFFVRQFAMVRIGSAVMDDSPRTGADLHHRARGVDPLGIRLPREL